jgi:hypothetical protein
MFCFSLPGWEAVNMQSAFNHLAAVLHTCLYNKAGCVRSRVACFAADACVAAFASQFVIIVL